MKHTITIENGVTIINTGDAIGGLKNKTGFTGLHYLEDVGLYVAKIHVKKKYYHLGRHEKLEDAIAVRKEAEKHRANGTLEAWLKTQNFSSRKRKK